MGHSVTQRGSAGRVAGAVLLRDGRVGKYDLSFELSEPEAYRRDVPNAEVHVLDAGHFALDTKADEIVALVDQFMKAQK